MLEDPTRNIDRDTTHALNIHGTFFERFCQHILLNSTQWELIDSNVPVQFPVDAPLRKSRDGVQSNLDLHAWGKAGSRNLRTYRLLVEAKKNNPDLSEWIFFPRVDQSFPYNFNCTSIAATGYKGGGQAAIRTARLSTKLVLCDDARETKGQHPSRSDARRPTLTANNSIQDAAFQVAVANQYLVQSHWQAEFQEGDYWQVAESPDLNDYSEARAYVPMIVTSATLRLCEFNVEDVDPATGEIPNDRASFTNVTSLLYEYPLPVALQDLHGGQPWPKDERPERGFDRLTIWVVNAQSLATLLESNDAVSWEEGYHFADQYL